MSLRIRSELSIDRTPQRPNSAATDFQTQVSFAKQGQANLKAGDRPMVTVTRADGSTIQQPFIGPVAMKPEPDGQTTHDYKSSESLDDIAKQYGVTKDEVLLTNPNPKPGDKLIILADKLHPSTAKARRDNAREMAETKDPQKLATLIAEDIELATMGSATPEDMLEDVTSELKARRPGDKAFETMVAEQGDLARSAWQSQGRTHEVFDPLNAAVQAGDWQKVEDLAKAAYATYAKTTPKASEIAKPRDMLLTYGPDNERFRQAVRGAEREFLVDDPKRAADDVRKAYKEGGVVQGADKLREVTNPEAADPLTAATIVKDLEPTLPEKDREPILLKMVDDYEKVGMPALTTKIGGALSSALDNASRTEDPAVDGVIDQIAGRFIEKDIAFQADMHRWIKAGDGMTLPLEIAAQLRQQGRTDDADHIVGIALGTLDQVNEDNVKLLQDLDRAEIPLSLPVLNADGYIREGTNAELDKWIADHPEEAGKIKDLRGQVNEAGYNLARSLSALEKYEPGLRDTEHYDKVRDNLSLVMHMGPDGPLPADQQVEKGPPTGDPDLTRILTLSEEGMIDSARALNLGALEQGASYDPYSLINEERRQVIADPSWPIRMVRNHILSDIETARQARPSGMGLSLFGTFTYGWGVKSHGQEFIAKVGNHGLGGAFFSENGWRNVGFVGLYFTGIGIEGKQAIDFARGGTPSLANKGAFLKHLKAFGWWNVLGTADYAAQGDWKRAGALGTAAGGTLWSTTLTSWKIAQAAGEPASALSTSWLGRAMKFGKFGGPVATAVTLLGSSAIWAIDQHERVALSNLTEPYAADYYTRMGIPHEIARHLGNNDKNGVDPFTRFDKIVEQTGLTKQEFMTWLVGEGKKPGGEEFVGDFIEKAVHQVEADDKGIFKMTDPDGRDLTVFEPSVYKTELDVVGQTDDRWKVMAPDGKTVIEVVKSATYEPKPNSIKGIVEWAELQGRPMPVHTP